MLSVQDMAKLANDFPLFAKTCLSVRTKSGKIEPLKFNDAQILIHQKIEEQKKRTGRVRMLILKGRKQGASTYVGARFYHRATHNVGQRVVVMAHIADSSDVLFSMTKLFYDNTPEVVRAVADRNSTKELTFPALTSSFAVRTAGSGESGRGDTPQMLHGSEVAFWKNTDQISAGALESVDDGDGTEIILESTANGMGNMFYEMCMKAQKGLGDYELIFIPWFMTKEYSRSLPENFALDDEEKAYKKAWGLSDEQMCWRRNKIHNSKGGVHQFKKEYPACVAEAFEASAAGALIPTELVMRARKQVMQGINPSPLLIGIDPAGQGKDTIGIALRQGRECVKVYRLPKTHALDNITGLIVDHVLELFRIYDPAMVYIDNGSIGLGVCDNLTKSQFGNRITRVNFANSATKQSFYANKRSEMWGEMKKWLEDAPCKIPDDDELHTDMVGLQCTHSAENVMKLESKDSPRRKSLGLPSPDLADALALTFAYPYNEQAHNPFYGNGGQPQGEKYKGYVKFF